MKKKNKIPTLEELLLEKKLEKFKLSEAEIVVSSVLSSVIKLAANNIRLLDVCELEEDYVFNKMKTNFTLYTNFLTLNPQVDRESSFINDIVIAEVKKPLIDTWASNKAKILSNKEDTPNENMGSTLNYFMSGTGFAKPMKKKNRMREMEDLYKKNLQNENTNLSETTLNFMKSNNLDKSRMTRFHENSQIITTNNQQVTTSNNITNPNQNLFKTSVVKSTLNGKGNITNNKQLSKLEQLIQQFEYEEYNVEEAEEEDFNDDKQLLIKKFRKMFEEREKDKAEKDLVEKDVKEKLAEIEKNKKKFLEELTKRPISLNFEGQVLKIKQIQQDRLGKLNTPLESVKLPKDEEMEIEKKEKELRSKFKTNKITKTKITLEDEIKPRKPEDVVELKFGPTEVELPVNYFQPNPLDFYELSDGVNFEFYGKTKKGMEYPSLPNKMNKLEFNKLLQEYCVKIGVLGDDKVPTIEMMEELSRITSQMDEKTNSFSQTKLKLNNIFTNEDMMEMINEQKVLKKGLTDIFKNDVSKKRLYELKKQQKDRKRKENKDLVMKDKKDFDLEQIESINDNKIQQLLNDPNIRDNLMMKNSVPISRMPKKVHIDDDISQLRNRPHKLPVTTDLEKNVKIKNFENKNIISSLKVDNTLSNKQKDKGKFK